MRNKGKEGIKNMIHEREIFSFLRKYSWRNKCYRTEDEEPIKGEEERRKVSNRK
jgi:hypothetical protein